MKTKIYLFLFYFCSLNILAQQANLLKDIHLGSAHSIPEYLTVFNNQLYFSAYDADHGNELWVSDGTKNGTHLLKDIRVPDFNFQESNSNPRHLTVLGNKLFFFADTENGTALWETDGTIENTRIAVDKDKNGVPVSSFRYMIEFNNKLYFQANNGSGLELFVSDGTENGTKMLKDINLEPLEGSHPKNFIVYKNNLYFTASDRTNGRELWVTNGTEEGTKLLKDISPGSYGSNPKYFEIFNDKLYFSAKDGNSFSSNGRELWVTDGNEENTLLVKNIFPGSGDSNPSYLKTLNNKMFFVATSENNDRELWVTDGTANGTNLFKNLNGNSLSSDIKDLTFYKNKLYFQAAGNSNTGRELWETDGTTINTKQTFDINNGTENSSPTNFMVFNEKLYFSANNGINGIELFSFVDNTINDGTRTFIPDDNFEQALIDLGYDDVLDDYVNTTSIKDVTSLELANKEIADLTGIQDFRELENLNINNNQITELDISNNEKLYNLSAQNNSISSFEVTNNYKLYGLSLKGNGLTSLKLMGIRDLADVNVAENNLTSLNLKAAKSLIGITANNNNLSILRLTNGNTTNIQVFDTRNNPDLNCIEVDDVNYANTNFTNKDNHTSFSFGCNYPGEIYIPDTNFERALIDLGLDGVIDERVLTVNIENIEKLEINGRNIADLTGIQGFTSLKELNVNNNRLTALRTNQNTSLNIIKAKNNNLTELITNNNLQLQIVDVSHNNFTTLSLSNSNNLQKLNCSNNENLTSLNLQNNADLKELIANNTGMPTIDISNNTRLTSLSVEANTFTSLDLTSMRDLLYLNINNNNISELNLTDTIALTNLIADNNQIESLDVTDAPNLVYFSAANNSLTSIDLRNGNSSNIQTYNTTGNLNLTCVQVDDVLFANRNFTDKDSQTQFYLDCSFYGQIYIPDTNFEQELINLGIDDNLDNYLSKNDASSVTELLLESKNISDLTGIEGFVNLQKLSVSNNNLTYLDVRRNAELLELNCSNNNLEELDVTFNTKLTDLKCESNQIKDINLKPLVNLVSTTIANNIIENLDISENLKLEFFEAKNNNLSCIQVKDVAYAEANWADNVDDTVIFLNDCDVVAISDSNLEESLIELGLDDVIDGYISLTNINNVRYLDISNKNISDLSIIHLFENLEVLICNNNNLTSLDVSNNLSLIHLDSSNNQITNLNLGDSSNLTYLNVAFNNLSSLNVGTKVNLEFLSCQNNNLVDLNVSSNTALNYLNCSFNTIEQLDVSFNTALLNFHCEVNRLTEIDLSNNINLTEFNCSNNYQLYNLDVSQNENLKILRVSDVPISEIDLENNILLTELNISYNEFSSIDITNNILIEKLILFDTGLTTLDVSNLDNLNELVINANENLECVKVANEDDVFAWNVSKDNQTNFSTDCSDIWTINVDPTTQTALAIIPNLDTNNDGNITLSEAAAFQGGLDLANTGITSVEGLQAFTSITILDISGNSITDLSPLTGLDIEIISKTTGKRKTVSRKSTAMALEYLYVNNNQITSANLDALTNLKEVDISNNPELITLSLKNGNNSSISFFDSRNTPKLTCIIVDDKEAAYLSTWNKDTTNNFVESEAQCRSEVLSVDNISLEENIKLYPNPVSSFLIIDSKVEIDSIEVYNLIGKQIVKTSEHKINFSAFSKGMYVVKIIADDKTLIKKVLKQY